VELRLRLLRRLATLHLRHSEICEMRAPGAIPVVMMRPIFPIGACQVEALQKLRNSCGDSHVRLPSRTESIVWLE
jgi:hypothetical protein